MSIKDVNQANFDEVVLRSTLPVLVDFNAEWCPPCQALHPILAELSDEVDSFERMVGLKPKAKIVKMMEKA